MRLIMQWMAFWLLGCTCAAHAGVTSEQQHTIRENTFEVVMKKPDKDPVSYEKPLPLDLLPFIERNDAYRSVGTAFALGNNTYVTAGHVFAAGIGSQFGPPALRRADGTVFDVDKILKFSFHEDYVVFSLRNDPAPSGFLTNRTPQLDEAVLAVGNALGEGVVIRDGLFTSETAEAQNGRWKWIRFSAAASPGNSGGPLCDAEGRVIGIVIGKSPNENLNYSMPIGRVLDGENFKARFDQKSLVAMPFMHGTVTHAYQDEFKLPLSWPVFVTTIQKVFALRGDEARAHLLKTFQDSLFPKGPGAASLLFDPDYDVEPRLIVQEADGTWTGFGSGYRNVDLPNDGIVGVAQAAGVRLVHLVRSAQASDDAFYSDSKTFMDLALRGLDLRRDVGEDHVRVTSLGPAQIDVSYSDSYGRKWQDRVYAVPYMDAYLLAMLLPTPDGYSGFTLLVPSFSLHDAREQVHLLAGQMDVSYQGTLAQWQSTLRRRAWLPTALSQVKVENSAGWTFQAPRFASGVPSDALPLTEKSLLTMTMGFMIDGEKTVWDIQGIRWDLDTRKEAAVEVWRRARPPLSAKLELRNRFDSIREHRSPFDGSLSRDSVETYSVSSVLDVPGRTAGTVAADLEYGLTLHLVGHPGPLDASLQLSRVAAATHVLERRQGTDVTPQHVSESPLDAVLDIYERKAKEFAAKHESDNSVPRDIRGRSFSDDVHDYVEILKKEVPGVVSSTAPNAASRWTDLQQQRFAWLQAYWEESAALMHNRDMWRPFLDKNHLANTSAHNANIGDAEHALLAVLSSGIPSEEWATRARALKEAYINERVNIVLYNRNPSSNSVALTPRLSPCPPAATTTSGLKQPQLSDNGHSLEEFWPMESKRLDEEGTVVVMVRISATGCMMGSAVVGSSGSDLLDGAVRRYLETSSWIPAGAAGTPVEYTATMPIKFKLH